MEAEWCEALPRLRERVGERNFATWIEPIQCGRDASGLRLEVASRFFQEWVSRHFLTTIHDVLAEGGRRSPALRVVVRELAGACGATSRAAVGAPPLMRRPKIGHLVEHYTFETFVVGAANETTYRAARAIADVPGRRFNPLFVCGGVGLGKTHLINALAHELLTHSPSRRVACLSAETFMNSLITAIRHDQMAAFRDRFRALDVLILDDVQFIAGKERTQEEFFHTFNALYAAGRQVVLTSDKPPHAIAELEQRLRSRFEGGLIADIRPPTWEMRLSIVIQKAAGQQVDLPADVADVVARCSGPSVRELEGALARVLATEALCGIPLSVEMARQVLAPVTPCVEPVSVETVQRVVSEHFRLSIADLTAHARTRSLAFPRQVAMYLSRTLAEASFPSIAEKFGGRDHSTVMYAVRTMEQRRQQDPQTGNLLSLLETQIRSCPAP